MILKLYSRNEKEFDSLVETITIFSKDKGMEVCMDKCAIIEKEERKDCEISWYGVAKWSSY